ncbi:hypothetical protein C8E00_102463 [Chromohalobacter marismortui]|uniref:Uncharacterized protein n=1 Tax=Chromohalobacter marismortui TaxID=42055 RepID=A0A4R7NSG8_9GAMM|nr:MULTISPECIES: hypothetical protein [Chromohalobacter]MCI0509145.1 hypothetical protein [Chromohalobacter sp.]MCI0592804.1 hypothetical protein [Chromohalobacter sp.]TDU23963.1 hypothetical protein C8E00_102463 [Chromohalobacter marismortui]
MPQVAKAIRRQRQGATRRRRAAPASRSRRRVDIWLDRLVSVAVLTALSVGALALLVTLLWG